MLSAPELDHAWIAAHVPHQGRMCLLHRVVEWNSECIVCEAVSHLDPHNPLRDAGRLGAAAGIEYAAQAMAVHGALLAAQDAKPSAGYLTSVRGLSLLVDRIDDQPGPLRISAERLSGDEQLILYQFAVQGAAGCLLEGRASVVLDASTL